MPFNFITFQRIANHITPYSFGFNISLYAHASAANNIARKISTTGYITTYVTSSRK